MTKEKSCGAIIYNDKNEVLVVKHNAGHWDFPKGHMEKGEDEFQTALREVKEETNIDIELYKNYRYEIHYSPKENVDKTVVFFLARNKSNELIKQDEEIANIGWFNYEEALNILTHDIAKELLQKSYNDLKNV
jgi:8-oxo-dGTP pyrophosphatase MutT (NUDIX family)